MADDLGQQVPRRIPWKWVVVLAVLVIVAVVLIKPVLLPTGAKDAEGAMLQVLDGLRQQDAGKVADIVVRDADRTKLSEQWVAEFGGLAVISGPSYGRTESDAFIGGDVQVRVRGELLKLEVLLEREEDARWYVSGIGRAQS